MKKVILFFAAVALVNAPEGTDWTLWFSSAIVCKTLFILDKFV